MARLRWFSPALLLLLCSAAIYAQLTRGFISGTVEDAAGAVIADVTVTITNTATGIRRETVTNNAGVYRFVAVEPGSYVVEFSKGGFETARISGIDVTSTQEVVINRPLAVATVSTTVEVQERLPGVDLQKSSATIERTLDQKLVQDLPTTALARDVTRLTLLAPTAVRVTGQGGAISVNGQRARNNNFTIDGVDNNDVSITSNSARLIPEQVGEFKVQTNAYSSEFGRNSGAQIAAITRSGTNAFHGEAWDYYSANWMEPLSLPQKRSGVTQRPRYVHNQAGGDIGGPIIRDKTFFFALLETNRRREAPNADNASTINIPTPQGYAALSGVPLGTNETTQARQAALSSLAFLPDIHSQITNYQNERNVNVNGVPIAFGSARIPLPNPFNYWYVASRVDHQLTARDSLSYRNNFDKQLESDLTSNLGFGTKWSGDQDILAQSHALAETHTFGPSLINEFRFSYGRRNLDFPEHDPVTQTTQITGAFTIGGTSVFPQGRIQNVFQYQDIITWLKGRHSFKAGADYRRVRFYNIQGFDTKGTWVFDSFADFLNSSPSSFRYAVIPATVDMRQNLQAFFFQDDFKVTKDLTLNLGARYEYNSYPLGLFGATDPAVLAVGVPGPPDPDKNNIAPRFGVAWSPTVGDGLLHTLLGNNQTVFRGGYGIAYDVYFLNLATNYASNYPRVVTATVNLPTTLNQYPNKIVPPNVGPVLNPLNSFANASPDTQNPTTQFYSFSIQREFQGGYMVELGYTGNRSYHQIYQGHSNYGILTPAQAAINIAAGNTSRDPGVQARRLNPAWGQRIIIETSGNSNYNAMFVKFDKRLSRNLTFGSSYTWSKFMSDSDESLAVTNVADTTPPVPQDYRNTRADWSVSAFDRPHRVVVYYSYAVPWFSSGSLAHPVLRHAFKDWEVTGFSEWQSGQPFTIITGVDSIGVGRSDSSRPDHNPNGVLQKDRGTGNYRTFTTPLDGTGQFVTPLTSSGVPLAFTEPYGGNLGRNTFRGPYFTHHNLNVSKTFSLTERLRLRFRTDFINLFNHRNFGPPVVNMSSPAFGQNTRNQVADFGRTMLMSLKVLF